MKPLYAVLSTPDELLVFFAPRPPPIRAARLPAVSLYLFVLRRQQNLARGRAEGWRAK